MGRVLGWFGADVSASIEQVESWLVSGAQNLLKGAAAVGGSFAIGVVGTLVSFFLMLFLLFFFLRDGQSMLMHLMRLVPMDPERRGRLLHYLSDVSMAVIFGHALTAVIQGALVGIGFAIAGMPSPVVFAVFAAIAAFIPAAGTGFVLVPAVIWLAAIGAVGLGDVHGRVDGARRHVGQRPAPVPHPPARVGFHPDRIRRGDRRRSRVRFHRLADRAGGAGADRGAAQVRRAGSPQAGTVIERKRQSKPTARA